MAQQATVDGMFNFSPMTPPQQGARSSDMRNRLVSDNIRAKIPTFGPRIVQVRRQHCDVHSIKQLQEDSLCAASVPQWRARFRLLRCASRFRYRCLMMDSVLFRACCVMSATLTPMLAICCRRPLLKP